MTIKEYVHKAIVNGNDITIMYEKYDGTLSTRRISNIQYSDEFGDEYIRCYCHKRKEERTFKISRIRKADNTTNNIHPTTTKKSAYTTKTVYTPPNQAPVNTQVNSNTTTQTNHPSSVLQNHIPSSLSKSVTSKNISTPISNVSKKHKSEGCYIATMAYGDYNHPQVKLLRTYRDVILNSNYIGRLFIRIYYATSPTIVKILNNKNGINSVIRSLLDRFVAYIKERYII